jgi:DNA-binding transcriptional regulator GbsR (MarR family)
MAYVEKELTHCGKLDFVRIFVMIVKLKILKETMRDIEPLKPVDQQKLREINTERRVKEIDEKCEEIMSGLKIDQEVYKKVYSAQPPKYRNAESAG